MDTDLLPPSARAAHEARDAHALPGVVGVLGGMGPLATIDFMRKMMAETAAGTDQEHIPMVVASIPQVPDRTQAFRGEGDSPVAAMVDSARRLRAAGAGLVVIACNTAHLWFDEVRAAVDLPMIHLVDAAIEDARAVAGGHGRIGLLGTDATVASGLYVNRVRCGGEPAGQPVQPVQPVQWALPTAGEMISLVMPGIAAVKAGELARGTELLERAAQALRRRGATAIVLGCTEIPVVLHAANSPLPVVDATAALARRAVAWSLARRAERATATATA